jgi:hypothetical protein
MTFNWQSGEVVSHREGRLECRVPLHRFLHCEVSQLVREHDRAGTIEVARGLVVDEHLVVCINIGNGEAICPLHPVGRVVTPDDRPQVKPGGDRTNAVLRQDNSVSSWRSIMNTLTSTSP